MQVDLKPEGLMTNRDTRLVVCNWLRATIRTTAAHLLPYLVSSI